jgi:hypothetical protein
MLEGLVDGISGSGDTVVFFDKEIGLCWWSHESEAKGDSWQPNLEARCISGTLLEDDEFYVSDEQLGAVEVVDLKSRKRMRTLEGMRGFSGKMAVHGDRLFITLAKMWPQDSTVAVHDKWHGDYVTQFGHDLNGANGILVRNNELFVSDAASSRIVVYE